MELGQTFNLAAIYGAAENAKGARMDNQLREQQLGMQTVLRDSIKTAVDPTTGEYRPSVAAAALAKAGYPEAGQELLAKQIEMGTKLEGYLGTVLPRLTAENYGTFLGQLEGLGMPKGTLPATYDQAAITGLARRMKSMTADAYSAFGKIADGPDGAAIYGQKNETTGEVKGATVIKPTKPGRPLSAVDGQGRDVFVDPDTGKETLPGLRPRPRQGDTPKPFQFKPADSNTIHRQVVTAYGGLYDPTTGQISGLDPAQGAKVQGIAADASRIYQQNEGQIDHATAVEQAIAKSKAPAAPPPSGAAPPANRPPLSSFRSR